MPFVEKQKLIRYNDLEIIDVQSQKPTKFTRKLPPIREQRLYFTNQGDIPDVPIIVSLVADESVVDAEIAEYIENLKVGYLVSVIEEIEQESEELSADEVSDEDSPASNGGAITIDFAIDMENAPRLPSAYEVAFHYNKSITIQEDPGLESHSHFIHPDRYPISSGRPENPVTVTCTGGIVKAQILSGILRTPPSNMAYSGNIDESNSRDFFSEESIATLFVKAVSHRAEYSVTGRDRNA